MQISLSAAVELNYNSIARIFPNYLEIVFQKSCFKDKKFSVEIRKKSNRNTAG